MASRDAVLADFQACTGIEDVEEAIRHLEAANWSLVDAVNVAMANPSEPSRPSAMPTLAESAGSAAAAAAAASAATGSSSSASTPASGMDTAGPYNPFTDSFGSGSARGAYGSAGVSIADDMLPSYSGGAAPRTRMLEFTIQHRDRMIHLKVPDNEDVKTLKGLLSQETGFPPCQQELTGFISSGHPIYRVGDRRRLSELNLPKENILYLTTPEPEENASNGETEPKPEDDASDFKLHVKDLSNGGKTYKLNFRPTQNVLNVKLDLSSLTNVPVSRQKWTGWPDDIADELTLAQIGIPREHHLTMDQLPRPGAGRDMPVIDVDSDQSPRAGPSSQPSSGPAVVTKTPEINVEDSDEDDYVDASDMMDDLDDDFMGRGGGATSTGTGSRSNVGSRLQSLLPDDYGSDETMAAIKFSEEFTNRYGSPHPAFFPGSMDEAIKASCMKPAKERKMLAIYLHHDSSVLTNVFCAQVLCSDSVVSFLNENFVTFGWDLTHHSNKTRAVNMITRHFGSVTSSTVKNVDVEKFPVIALIYRLRGNTEIFQIFHGNQTLDEVMSRLLSAQETFTSQLATEVREEEQREARDAVKREQDLAYEMSLQADREKEAQKKRELEERLEQERLDEILKKTKEEEEARLEAEKRKQQQKIRSQLPKEPQDEKTEGVPVSQLRFRVPAASSPTCDQKETASGPSSSSVKNGFLTRRFLASSHLQVVLDFLASEGYPSQEFKVLSSWPRRDLSQLDADQSLQALKLYPQETLTLEEK